MDRVLDRGEAGVRPALAGAEHLAAAVPVPRRVPGARERRADGAGLRRERQRPLEERDGLPGVSRRQFDRAEPEEREGGSGVEFERLPVGGLGGGPVTEFFP